jgi:hypothetical protein
MPSHGITWDGMGWDGTKNLQNHPIPWDNSKNFVPWDDFFRPIPRGALVSGICVWIGISWHGIIGPLFFGSTVTGESYVEMLQGYFQSAVADWLDLNDLWYQHDGSPAHYSRMAP